MAAYAKCSRDSMQVAAALVPTNHRYPLAESEDMAKEQPLFPQVKPQRNNTRVSKIESTSHIAHRLSTCTSLQQSQSYKSLFIVHSSAFDLHLLIFLSTSLHASPPSFTPSPHLHLSRFLPNAHRHHRNISLTLCRSPENHANIGSLRGVTLRLIRQ